MAGITPSPKVVAPKTEAKIRPVWDWQGAQSLAQFAKNCAALQERSPELATQLQKIPFPPNVQANDPQNDRNGWGNDGESRDPNGNNGESGQTAPGSREQSEAIHAEQSRDGNWLLCYEGKPLYSRYRPLEDSRRWMEGELRKSTNAVIFAGLGLGYQIEALLRLRSKALVLLVEPSYALFKAALCLRDLSEILASPHFFCSVGPKAHIDHYLYHFSERCFQLYQLQPLYRAKRDFYLPLQRRILSLLNRFRVNANTLNRFGRLWVQNIALNLRHIATASDAQIFYRQFEGLPFLLIAAGPSLEDALGYLSALRERFVLLAVDTALGVLLQNGIEPDFVISVDPQLLNARHFDGCFAPNTVLLAESCIHPSIFTDTFVRRWRHCALFHSSFPLMARLEARLCPETGAWAKLRSGGSVATAAWDFARNCDGSSLYMLGLDFSYPTLRSHCPGTQPQRQIFAQGERLKPAEQINWQSTICAGTLQSENWNGSQTRSDKRMDIYRNWLEESLKNIAASKSWPNYVLSGCGGQAAKIAGMELLQLPEALKLPPRRNEIEQHINAIFLREQTASKPPQTVRRRLLREELIKIQAEVQEVLEWSAELLALLCEPNAANAEQQKRLQKLQDKISQSPSRRLLGFLFTKTLAQIAGRSPEQALTEQYPMKIANVVTKAAPTHIERVKVYHQFYLSSKFHMYWLATAQKQLEDDNLLATACT